MPCFHHISIHCSVFKVQLLFQSNCCFASQNCNLSSEYSSSSTERRIICRASRAIESFSRFEARSQNPISWVLRSNSKLDLVGPSGLEPPTLRLSVVRSSQLSYGPVQYGLYSVGGDSRDRTGDLLLARQALSQLSYIPKLSSFAGFAYTL